MSKILQSNIIDSFKTHFQFLYPYFSFFVILFYFNFIHLLIFNIRHEVSLTVPDELEETTSYNKYISITLMYGK